MPPKAQWDGSYYDGQTARRVPVKVIITKTGLRVARPDGQEMRWPWEAIRKTQGGQPGENVRLEHGPGETPEAVELADAAFLDAVRALAPDARLGRSWLRGNFAMVVGGAAAGIVGSIAAMYMWGIPALADHAAQHVPQAWEEGLGSYVWESMAPDDKRCHDKAKQVAVEKIVQALTKPLHSRYTYKVAIVADEDVNAFAAPGGYIVVFTGLLAKTKRPEELAGVLAHEVQHVEKRHTTRSLLRQLSLQVLLSALTGDQGQLGTLLGTAGNLGDLAYQRGDEEEADREGMKLMMAANLDPKGMIGAFEMLRKEIGVEEDTEKSLSFLSSHPATGDRIKTLTSLAAADRGKHPALMPGVKWSSVATGCK